MVLRWFLVDILGFLVEDQLAWASICLHRTETRLHFPRRIGRPWTTLKWSWLSSIGWYPHYISGWSEASLANRLGRLTEEPDPGCWRGFSMLTWLGDKPSHRPWAKTSVFSCPDSISIFNTFNAFRVGYNIFQTLWTQPLGFMVLCSLLSENNSCAVYNFLPTRALGHPT